MTRQLVSLLLLGLGSCSVDDQAAEQEERTKGADAPSPAAPGDDATGGTPSAGGSPTGDGDAQPVVPATGGSPVLPPGDCSALEQTVEFAPALFSRGQDPSGTAACTNVLNPERGFRGVVNLRNPGDYSSFRAQGHSTVYGYALIPEYREKDLDSDLLDTLDVSLEAIRTAGLKVIFRAYYAPAMDPDAPLDRVLAHIEQLGPLLREHSDVIAAAHAGFVGAWGEWHSSTNDLTDPSARKAIFDALLDELPEDRMILARRPSHKEQAYGGPLSEADGFSQSPLARVGHLNDCLLASDSDFGTYALPGEKDFAAQDSGFTAVDGETCAVNPPRSECSSALNELAQHHFSLLNIAYNGDVLDSWREGGCFEEIACRLGYRLALLSQEIPSSASPGSALSIGLRLVNDGYARLFNPRQLHVVLINDERKYEFATGFDVRQLAPGQEEELCLAVSLPEDVVPGNYRLGLSMPDSSARLRDDERFAVQLANAVEWSGGVNFFEADLTVQ